MCWTWMGDLYTSLIVSLSLVISISVENMWGNEWWNYYISNLYNEHNLMIESGRSLEDVQTYVNDYSTPATSDEKDLFLCLEIEENFRRK